MVKDVHLRDVIEFFKLLDY